MGDSLDHLHHTRQVYDMTTLGRALARAFDEAAARNLLHLGTAAIWDVPATGNASVSQVVIGTDTRMTDARTPVGTALAYAKLWVGDINGAAAAVDMSGDATISGSGAVGLKSNVARKDSDNAFSAAQTIAGTAPSSVGTGQVAIGGGNAIFGSPSGGGIHLQALSLNNSLIMDNSRYDAGTSTFRALSTGPGSLLQFSSGYIIIYTTPSAVAGAGHTFTSRLSISPDGISTFTGTAPSSVSAGQVAIGGGEIRAAGNVKIGGKVGFNNAAPIAKPTLNAACTDLATCVALTNQIRSALINYGLCQ